MADLRTYDLQIDYKLMWYPDPTRTKAPIDGPRICAGTFKTNSSYYDIIPDEPKPRPDLLLLMVDNSDFAYATIDVTMIDIPVFGDKFFMIIAWAHLGKPQKPRGANLTQPVLMLPNTREPFMLVLDGDKNDRDCRNLSYA